MIATASNIWNKNVGFAGNEKNAVPRKFCRTFQQYNPTKFQGFDTYDVRHIVTNTSSFISHTFFFFFFTFTR